MIRTRALAAALTAGAIATAIATMPAQGHHSFGHDPMTAQTIAFTATQGPHDERFIDLAPRGPSAGDRVALVSTLRRDGKVAAVTGGTGSYQGATGTMSRTSGRDADTLELVLGS